MRKVDKVEVNYSRAAKQVGAAGDRRRVQRRPLVFEAVWQGEPTSLTAASCVSWHLPTPPSTPCLTRPPDPASAHHPPLPQVDVRSLKELMWRGLHSMAPPDAPSSPDSVLHFQVSTWALQQGRAPRPLLPAELHNSPFQHGCDRLAP